MSFQKQYLLTLEWQMTLRMIIKTAGSQKDMKGIKEDAIWFLIFVPEGVAVGGVRPAATRCTSSNCDLWTPKWGASVGAVLLTWKNQ